MAHTADLELTAEELRVLGSLIEKERATPDQYPLTTNALRTACNQKSNRDPVVAFNDADLESAMLSLRDKGYARTVTGSGRTVKHKQVIDEALGLTNGEVSLLGVLMLRGPQTPNELRTRTERLHGFDDNDAVQRTLDAMAIGEPPLVRCIGRASGQREDRWVHLLAGEAAVAGTPLPTTATSAPASTATATATLAHAHAEPSSVAAAAPSGSPAQPSRPETGDLGGPPPEPAQPQIDPGEADRIAQLESDVTELRTELDQLRDRFDDLATQLGISPS